MGMHAILRRFYLPKEKIDREAVITGDELHYLRDVLRLKIGDKIEITNGVGHLYHGFLSSIGKTRALVRIEKRIFTSPPKVKIYLCPAFLKAKAMDLIIQKATELGTWGLYVCLTDYTVPILKNKEKKIMRWKKIAISALKQSGNNYLPQIGIMSFKEAISKAKGLKLIAIGPREGKATPVISYLNSSSREIWICIGPEGGFTDEEIWWAKQNRFIPVSLSPHILRSETAAVAVLSIVHAYYNCH